MAEETKTTESTLPPTDQTVPEAPAPATTDESPMGSEVSVATKLKPMNFVEILAVPFNDVPYDTDFFEQALLRLYRKGFNIYTVFLFHFFILGPVMSLPYLRPIKKINVLRVGLRFLIALVIPVMTYFAIYYTLYAFDYEYLFPAIMGIVAGAFVVAYAFMSLHDFRQWSAAYVSLRPLLKNYKPPKVKKVKKVKAPEEAKPSA